MCLPLLRPSGTEKARSENSKSTGGLLGRRDMMTPAPFTTFFRRSLLHNRKKIVLLIDWTNLNAMLGSGRYYKTSWLQKRSERWFSQ